MTSTTFFIIFVPILAFLLLGVNLLLAPHNPYQEKDSVFECGFHSFLGQNRTQFSISFFIFGLLFLLFDLEILLVYPYSVSSYTNDIYGLVVMMVFFVLLTLGFVFELGKNALTIESRQTSFNKVEVSTTHVLISSINRMLYILSQTFCSSYMVKPHTFATKTLKSDIGISVIITELGRLLPQLADFIDQFNTTVDLSGGIKVVTDIAGNMSMDVPNSISDEVANKFSTKISIIDRLVTSHGQDIRDLLEKGTNLENKLKMADSNYASQLTDKIQEFRRLNSLYNH